MADKKKRGCGFHFACFMGIGVLGQVLVAAFAPRTTGANPQPTTVATRDPLLEADAKRVLMGKAGVLALRGSLRDPDSLVVETVQTDEDARLVCITYRARNGFGGMNREFVAYDDGKARQSDSFWNAHCARPLWEMTERVKRIL